MSFVGGFALVACDQSFGADKVASQCICLGRGSESWRGKRKEREKEKEKEKERKGDINLERLIIFNWAICNLWMVGHGKLKIDKREREREGKGNGK